MAELRELSYAECRGLLVRQRAGRVAVSAPDGPHIIPVNHSVVDESIVFRTTPFSVVATYARNSRLAFQVDHFDEEHGHGWSVLARGRAHVVSDPEELLRIRKLCAPLPWADGARNVYFRLDWKELSGRAVGPLSVSSVTEPPAHSVAAAGLPRGGPRLMVAPDRRS